MAATSLEYVSKDPLGADTSLGHIVVTRIKWAEIVFIDSWHNPKYMYMSPIYRKSKGIQARIARYKHKQWIE